MSQSKDWCYTLNNYTIAQSVTLDDIDAVYHVWGYERAASDNFFNLLRHVVDPFNILRKQHQLPEANIMPFMTGSALERFL